MKQLKYLIFAFILLNLNGLNLIWINLNAKFEIEPTRLYADDLSELKISGYGTISTSFDDRQFIKPARDIGQSSSRGIYRTDWTTLMDSRLGLQAHYRANQDLDFVVQGVLRDQAYVTFKNSLESAYFAFRPDSWIELRGGRIGYDAFLMSDTRNLGYAYSWVRPPIEFYGWIPIFHIDGADTTFRLNGEDSQWRLRLQAGEQGLIFPINSVDFDSSTTGLHAITISRQSGNIVLKAGYSKFSFKNEFELFSNLHSGEGYRGLEQIMADSTLPPEIIEEARYLHDNVTFKGVNVTYITFGASYDDGDWILQAEIAQSTSTAEVFSHGKMGYAALGYRIRDFTPYFIYSAIRAGNDVRQPLADWSALEESWLQSQSIGIINTTRMDQETLSLGVRWDFHLQAALKFQLDNTHYHSNGHGLVFCSEDTLLNDNRMTLGTISMEVMF
ncbi:MAG: hypothetical protein HQK72_00640 [Desulfamplus sp.]|nr:hypothetical protein [Desulfamplus sp.]